MTIGLSANTSTVQSITLQSIYQLRMRPLLPTKTWDKHRFIQSPFMWAAPCAPLPASNALLPLWCSRPHNTDGCPTHPPLSDRSPRLHPLDSLIQMGLSQFHQFVVFLSASSTAQPDSVTFPSLTRRLPYHTLGLLCHLPDSASMLSWVAVPPTLMPSVELLVSSRLFSSNLLQCRL